MKTQPVQRHYHVNYRSQAHTTRVECVLTSQSLAGARRLLASLMEQGFVTCGWSACAKNHGRLANEREDAA